MADQPDELVITLRKPLKLGEQSWPTLELREPTAAEWQQWDKLTGVEADIKAVAVVSGLPEPAIRLLGTRDLIKASGFIAGFLSIGPETGNDA